MSDGKPVKGWWLFVLVAVGFLGLVGGGLVAFLGSAAAEDAADQLASARSRLAAEESEVAGGELRVAAAEQALAIVRVTLTSAIDSRKTAEARVVDAEEVLGTAESALAEADATRARTEGAVLAFYSAAADVVARATEVIASDDRFLHLRREQQAFALAGEYAEVTRLDEELSALTGLVNPQLDGLSAVFTDLPQPELGPGNDPPLAALLLLASSPVFIDPPTGPAEVTATIPDLIECIPAGRNGCDYRVTVTFEESNTLEATVERVGIRWIERARNSWWIARDGEFEAVEIVIPADGVWTQTVFIFVDADSRHRRIMGGRVRIRFNGTDAESNKFKGELTARLERL